MNKNDLIKAVVEKTSHSKAIVQTAVNGVFETIAEELSKGNEVAVTGFGTFSVKEYEERQGRNPKTGEQITIPALKRIKFKASKALTDKI